MTLSLCRVSLDCREELEGNLFLFYTGISRSASEIAGQKIKELKKKKADINQMMEFVDIATQLLYDNNLNDFGKLLHESWLLKRNLAGGVSNNRIDDLYETGIKSGALGGKLLGAGGGGFLLFYVPKDAQDFFQKQMQHLLWVPFKFENQGSHLMYYDPPSFVPESLLRRNYLHLEHEETHLA